jgi:uncharacterized NAD-dependent epimerase/dehydratase family protein
LIKMYGKEVIGVTLNTRGLTIDQALRHKEEYEQKLGIPVALPVERGVDDILGPIRELIKRKNANKGN